MTRRGAVSRGFALVIWTYGLMAVMGLLTLPVVALGPRAWTRRVARAYVALVLGGARVLCGLRVEVRGTVPRGAALVAAKHQSFLDILILAHVLDRPRYVMKRSLLWAPVLGLVARRMGCVAIDRNAGGRALRAMLSEAAADTEADGQMVIFPQGTRVTPGEDAPWRSGVAGLYTALGLGCVPAATNAGVFWPRRGVARFPGVAVVEFLPAIPPGLTAAEVMARLREEVEAASDRLLDEARRGG